MNKVLFKGVMNLGGMQLPCYVLDNGVRVISGKEMQKSLKMIDEGEVNPSGTRLTRYLGQKTINPFISKYLGGGHLTPIKCMDGKTIINGYRAEALADICDAFLEARRNIKREPQGERHTQTTAIKTALLASFIIYDGMKANEYYNAIAAKIKRLASEHGKYMQACSTTYGVGGILLVGLYIPDYKRYKTFVLRSDMTDEALKVVYSDVVGRMEVLKTDWECAEKARKRELMFN